MFFSRALQNMLSIESVVVQTGLGFLTPVSMERYQWGRGGSDKNKEKTKQVPVMPVKRTIQQSRHNCVCTVVTLEEGDVGVTGGDSCSRAPAPPWVAQEAWWRAGICAGSGGLSAFSVPFLSPSPSRSPPPPSLLRSAPLSLPGGGPSSR